MADHASWARGYARQAQADFQTFEKLQAMPVPECHKLQFLQMACEKLVKAHLCEGSSGRSTASSYEDRAFRNLQHRPSHGEAVIAREHQINRLAVGAHPFGGERAHLSWSDVPSIGEVHRRPRPPGFWCIIDPEPALKTRVTARQNLAPKESVQTRIIADCGPVATPIVAEHGTAPADVGSPSRFVHRVAPDEELVRASFPDPAFRHPCQDHPIGGLIGVAVVMRVDVNVIIACSKL
jgi:hypothetical protein